MMMKKQNNTIITVALALAAILLIVPVVMTSNNNNNQAAFASGASNTLDPNGFLRKDPVAGYSMSFDAEHYIDAATKNFRSDGSMRIDFEGRNTDSLLIGGYFNVVKGDNDNTNWCVENAGNPGEEISTKINGGPHTGSVTDPNYGSLTEPNAAWADVFDFGVINAEGDDSRLRFEVDHPDYEPETAPGAASSGLPLDNDLCSVPGGWVGVMTEKFNKDTNCDGIVDRIEIFNFVDESGLHPTTGAPQNNWERVWYKNFQLSEILTKGKVQPYVQDIGQGPYTQQTLRIDNQDQASWLDTADLPYKFVTLKRIINIMKDGCGTPLQAQQPGMESFMLESEGPTTIEEQGLVQEDSMADQDNNGNDDVTADDSDEEEEEEEEEPEEPEEPEEE